MTHPLERWPASGRRRALWAAIVASLLLQVVLTLLDGPLRETGDGTVPFELAGSAERADEIVSGWRSAGVLENAAFLAGLDFLFAPLYAAALAGLAVAVSQAWRRRRRSRLAALGIVAAWAVTAAAGFDWIENVALTVTMLDEPSQPWPAVALVAAIAKFTGVAAALAYALSGVAFRLSGRSSGGAGSSPGPG